MTAAGSFNTDVDDADNSHNKAVMVINKAYVTVIMVVDANTDTMFTDASSHISISSQISFTLSFTCTERPILKQSIIVTQ